MVVGAARSHMTNVNPQLLAAGQLVVIRDIAMITTSNMMWRNVMVAGGLTVGAHAIGLRVAGPAQTGAMQPVGRDGQGAVSA